MTPTITKYSQQDEQRYILDAVKDIHAGRLLDIGAWHPTQFSNSRALLETGWSGVLVEPSPEPLVNLIKEYGMSTNVRVVAGAVGLETSDFATLHVTPDAVSTTEEHEYEKWKRTASFTGRLTVPVVSMADLYHSFGPFDFIDIDTEGTSVDIFKDLMRLISTRGVIGPACICVEHNERRADVFLAGKGLYETIHQNDTNLVLKAI